MDGTIVQIINGIRLLTLWHSDEPYWEIIKGDGYYIL